MKAHPEVRYTIIYRAVKALSIFLHWLGDKAHGL